MHQQATAIKLKWNESFLERAFGLNQESSPTR
jgi:hypothetical protein